MKIDVVNIKNKKVSEIELSDSVFGCPLRVDILSRVVEWQLAKRRQGTHKTKEISEVSGTGKKVYRQKGTGSARHRSRRAPQFRGGSVIFGPVVRDHGYDLPKKIRRLGLKIALSSKIQTGDLIVLDAFTLDQPKTKNLEECITKLNAKNALFIDNNEVNENILLASGNIIGFDSLPQIGANVYDILRKDKVILTVDALKALEARLK